MKRLPPARSDVLQLKVTLDGFEPPIWRRFLIEGERPVLEAPPRAPGGHGLGGLHLHQFENRLARIPGPPEAESGEQEIDESSIALCDVVREGMLSATSPTRRLLEPHDRGREDDAT